MSDFALIVLTALVNFLVTGLAGKIIVDGYKRDIDFKYDKQMEQFKNSLQNLSFEHQTKFVKNHEKMVETLEALYQKYSIFVTELGNTILINKSSNKKDLKLSKLVSPLIVELSQFHKYFNINKIYLSEGVVVFYS